jgi:hypothetical protein
MCLACQMDDELWFAYLDHVAQQETAAGQAAGADASTPSEAPKPEAKPAAASPFVCEEQPSE